MPRNGNILAYLKAHRDARLVAVDDRLIRKWLADIDAGSRRGVRRAWLVGRALNAERELLDYGEVEAWEKARAKELGRTARTLASYRYLAENLDDRKIAESLQISDADRGVDALLRAIRRAKKRGDGPVPMTNTDKALAWKKRARRLLKAVPQGRLRTKLLREHLTAVRELLGELLEERAA